MNKLTKTQVDRINKLAKSEFFITEIVVDEELLKNLQLKERQRLDKKLILVQQAACELAARMVKGTIKYPTDDWSVEQYNKYQEDEMFDLINYLLLKQQAQLNKNI